MCQHADPSDLTNEGENAQPEIVEGLIVGVGAGTTVAVILETWRWLARIRDRGEQISFIRELVADKMRDILTARDLPPLPGGMGRSRRTMFASRTFVNSGTRWTSR